MFVKKNKKTEHLLHLIHKDDFYSSTKSAAEITTEIVVPLVHYIQNVVFLVSKSVLFSNVHVEII